MKTAHLAEELEWQFKLGVGWYQAMHAVGYTNERALYRQLHRIGRPDLAHIFFPPKRPRKKEAA